METCLPSGRGAATSRKPGTCRKPKLRVAPADASEPATTTDRGFSPLQTWQCSATWRTGWGGQVSTGFVQHVASFAKFIQHRRAGCVEFGQIQLLRIRTSSWRGGKRHKQQEEEPWFLTLLDDQRRHAKALTIFLHSSEENAHLIHLSIKSVGPGERRSRRHRSVRRVRSNGDQQEHGCAKEDGNQEAHNPPELRQRTKHEFWLSTLVFSKRWTVVGA